MPTVATFDGIKIMLYNDEHPPPHFHAKYAEHEVLIEIDTLAAIYGELPIPQLRSVKSRAGERQAALLMAWIACQSDVPPGKIP